MQIISHVDFLVVLSIILSGVFCTLVAVLAWIGNNMYGKLEKLDQMFSSSLATMNHRFNGLEGRIIRLETHLENVTHRPNSRTRETDREFESEY